MSESRCVGMWRNESDYGEPPEHAKVWRKDGLTWWLDESPSAIAEARQEAEIDRLTAQLAAVKEQRDRLLAAAKKQTPYMGVELEEAVATIEGEKT